MKRLSLTLIIALSLLSFLASCSGSGSSDGGAEVSISSPYIYAEIASFSDSDNSSVFVILADSSSGDPIVDAVVTINGATLTYDTQSQEYLGNLQVAPGGSVSLSVTTDGNTYTASGKQFTTFPAITTPVSEEILQANITNTVVWTDGMPISGAIYGLGVLNADLGGELIWPSDVGFQIIQPGVNSFSFPKHSLSVGNRFIILGIASITSIPSADYGSNFVISCFDYVPITIMDSSGSKWSEYFPKVYSYLDDVIWSGTQFLSVGYAWNNRSGSVYTSLDGKSWSDPIFTDINTELMGVAWSGSQYVAVGNDWGNSTGYIVSSPNGNIWTRRTSNTSAKLNQVVWSGTQFIAVGENGTILRSLDGETWVVQISNTSKELNDIVWSGYQFVAVGESGTIITSTDGSNWTQQNSGVTSYLHGITWSGTQFVTVGTGILTSQDGISWAAQTSFNYHGLALRDVAWSGTHFAAVSNGYIYISEDGITWTEHLLRFSIDLYSIVWSGTQFLSVGYDYGTSIVTSP